MKLLSKSFTLVRQLVTNTQSILSVCNGVLEERHRSLFCYLRHSLTVSIGKTLLVVVTLLGSSFGFANVDSCKNVYQVKTGKIRSELLSSLVAKIDGVSWSLSSRNRSSAQNKLWQEVYSALNEPSDNSPQLSLEETRQLA
jgi:hypothetical protein